METPQEEEAADLLDIPHCAPRTNVETIPQVQVTPPFFLVFISGLTIS
jgi:hypothetical protein